MQRIVCLAAALMLLLATPLRAQSDDPFLWLEDKDGARAMTWVREQNAKTLSVLQADPHYADFYKKALAIEQSKDRIPMPGMRGGEIYNVWQDAAHVQGIWRRTSSGRRRKTIASAPSKRVNLRRSSSP